MLLFFDVFDLAKQSILVYAQIFTWSKHSLHSVVRLFVVLVGCCGCCSWLLWLLLLVVVVIVVVGGCTVFHNEILLALGQAE